MLNYMEDTGEGASKRSRTFQSSKTRHHHLCVLRASCVTQCALSTLRVGLACLPPLRLCSLISILPQRHPPLSSQLGTALLFPLSNDDNQRGDQKREKWGFLLTLPSSVTLLPGVPHTHCSRNYSLIHAKSPVSSTLHRAADALLLFGLS